MRIGPLGLPELLIILLVVLLIFGPRRLPDMAKGLGQSVREFRRGLKDMKEDFESEVNGDDDAARSKKQSAAAGQTHTSQAAAPAATPAATPAAAASPTPAHEPSETEAEAKEA